MKNGYSERVKSLLRKNPQLSEAINKRKRAFFIKTVITELLIIALCVYVYTELSLYSAANTYVVFIVGAFLCLAAPLLFNPIGTFKNEKYGIVKRAEVRSCFVKRPGTARGMMNSLVYTVTVLDEKEFTTDLDLPKHHEKCFFEGDEVVMLDALAYPINLTEHENVACPFCGNVMPLQNRDCLGCGRHNIYKYR